MVKDIIVEELGQGRRVVVPGFGAFIAKEGVIVFVEFLKRDDGVLRSLIESRMDLDGAAATLVIENFVSSIKNAISSKGDFNFEPLGTMAMDDNGVYVLRSQVAKAQDSFTKPAPAPAATEPPKRPDMRVNVQRPTPTPTTTPSPTTTQTARAQEPPTTFARTSQSTPMPQPTTPSVAPTPKPVAMPQSVQTPPTPKRENGNDMRYQRPADKNGNISSAPAKRVDSIMIIAIIVAILSIGVMIYGMMSDTAPKIELVENPVDSTQLQ